MTRQNRKVIDMNKVLLLMTFSLIIISDPVFSGSELLCFFVLFISISSTVELFTNTCVLKDGAFV